MRNVPLIIVMVLCLASCADLSKKTDADAIEQGDLITMRGEFIYDNGAAVLQTPQTIYGVVQNKEMETLRNSIKSLISSDLEMAMVTLKARRIPKPEGEEGWPYSIEINEILKIEEVASDASDLIEISK